MTKVRLLNNGGNNGFASFNSVTFPVEVNGTLLPNGIVEVRVDELMRIGVTFRDIKSPLCWSRLFGTCEVVDNG